MSNTTHDPSLVCMKRAETHAFTDHTPKMNPPSFYTDREQAANMLVDCRQADGSFVVPDELGDAIISHLTKAPDEVVREYERRIVDAECGFQRVLNDLRARIDAVDVTALATQEPALDLHTQTEGSGLAEELAATIVREVAELPDRTSPEDWPEAMLVTADELTEIVLTALQSGEANNADQ